MKWVNPRRGEAHHKAKLTVVKVRELRRLREQKKLCIKCIAILHNVPYVTCWDAIHYRTWKDVK